MFLLCCVVLYIKLRGNDGIVCLYLQIKTIKWSGSSLQVITVGQYTYWKLDILYKLITSPLWSVYYYMNSGCDPVGRDLFNPFHCWVYTASSSNATYVSILLWWILHVVYDGRDPDGPNYPVLMIFTMKTISHNTSERLTFQTTNVMGLPRLHREQLFFASLHVWPQCQEMLSNAKPVWAPFSTAPNETHQ